MQAMISDLLDFARTRHGQGMPVRPRPARLGEICQSAVEEVRSAWPTRTVAIEVSGDDGATLDPGRVEQVVSNLVANALAHGAADAPVEVAIREDGAAVCLEVTSQGATIPPQRLPTLFDPFHPSDAPGGVGLGLYIVDQIARAHGGSAAARSAGGRTTFTVRFPRGAAAGGAPA